MKKIFFLLESLGDNGGGSERVVVNLCNQLSKQNPNIYLLSLTNKGSFYKKIINKKVNLILFPFTKSVYSIFYLYKFLNKNKPNIVFCTSFHLAVYAAILKILLKNSFSLVTRISNNIDKYFNYNKSLKWKLIYFLYFYFVKDMDRIVSPSKELMNNLKKKLNNTHHKKIILIHNPVDFNYVINKSKLINRKISSTKKNFFLSIGRLVLNKDYYTLIKAFKYFLTINKNFNDKYCLVIIGSGTLYGDLVNFIKKEDLNDKIILLKATSNPYSYIAKSKIFILSSIYEGYPNVLLEAQALKKKIISTDCNYGPKEILQYGKYGFLVKTGDYKNLGLTMAKALNTKNKTISLKNLKKINSIEIITSKYFDLFLNLNEK
jgi:glycosyltransferase involved in cell wall biosynthesis